MQEIDSDIYKRLENLKTILVKANDELEKNKQTEIKDLVYLGSIDWSEIDHTGIEVKTKKDIYASIEEKDSGENLIKYYDENNELMAINLQNINQTIPTAKYIKDNDNGLYLKAQLEELDIEKAISLNEINSELDKISETLNIPKEKILSISKCEASNLENESQTEKENDKIQLKDEKNSLKSKNKEEQNENNSNKKNPNIKQETDLSQKINDRYTLGDILGVPQDGKLVAVYSSAVENNTNSTRFTFLIEDKDGNFMPCENLEQVAGTAPTNDIYASNYNGSVKKEQVNSMYRIKSPHSNEGYILTADIGAMGTVDLGLGQEPKMQSLNESQTGLVTTPLKTTSTYNTKPQVKETIHSYSNGKYQPDSQVKEAKQHNDDCSLTIDEVDGDEQTGEQHLNKDDMLAIIDEINLLDKKSNEYSSNETLLSDLISTYLSGEQHPIKEEFLKACERCENEHSRVRNNDH